MPQSQSKTARELCALVEPLLADLSPKEQRKFLMLMTDDPRNTHYHKLLELHQKTHEAVGQLAIGAVRLFVEETNELLAKLKKHRKPAKNAERDAEIMRLDGVEKTAGEIVRALKGRFELTDRMVTAVISRQRNKPKED